ncbi:pyrroline-5-carboxylate reductase [Paenibacillus eucommiae]|uniref:Pyrroline-5-carboxylate reductase n=1 Tax=Paenibacillus eucommiae TaxID=1355755 RepID=A0ABS4J4P4_9BACL|nr:pyrroline-5-carboxylate reductase [Paenibacillus eucommiae]MBP1994785.1 pyrroline-5-carboxylate reductase [Paenibacillus eucommiae]
MTSSIAQKRIAFVGAGSMAEALFRGLIERNITQPEQLYVMNRSDQAKLDRIHKQYGVHVSSDTSQREAYISQADVVVVCMKPKDAVTAFQELKVLLNERQLLISVIAGLSIEKMETLLGSRMPIARTMPNTSSTIGLGATGISFSASVGEAYRQLVIQMFEAVGIVTIVEEAKLEIVTGLSGSGPAYVYYFIEAMIHAAVEGGLPEQEARKLTIQTLLGAAHMVQQTQEDPAELRRKVTSPGGATQAAIEALDRYQFKEGVVTAVTSSAERAKQMGEQIITAKQD